MTLFMYIIYIGINLLLPWVASRYWIKRPLSYWITIPLYIIIINSVNILWAIKWGLSLKPGIAFFFYFVWVLSAGYQSNRSVAKSVAAYTRENDEEASTLLERATKMLAKGQNEAALNEYSNIIKYYPDTDAAKLAEGYISQIRR